MYGSQSLRRPRSDAQAGKPKTGHSHLSRETENGTFTCFASYRAACPPAPAFARHFLPLLPRPFPSAAAPRAQGVTQSPGQPQSSPSTSRPQRAGRGRLVSHRSRSRMASSGARTSASRPPAARPARLQEPARVAGSAGREAAPPPAAGPAPAAAAAQRVGLDVAQQPPADAPRLCTGKLLNRPGTGARRRRCVGGSAWCAADVRGRQPLHEPAQLPVARGRRTRCQWLGIRQYASSCTPGTAFFTPQQRDEVVVVAGLGNSRWRPLPRLRQW